MTVNLVQKEKLNEVVFNGVMISLFCLIALHVTCNQCFNVIQVVSF